MITLLTVANYNRVGVSRSATVVLAFLMGRGLTLAEAWVRLRASRPIVNPNLGFWEQLCAREVEIHGVQSNMTESSMKLQDYLTTELREVWPDSSDRLLQEQVAREVASNQDQWVTGTVFDCYIQYLRVIGS